MRSMKRMLVPAADLVLAPVLYPWAWLLRKVREVGIERMPLCRRALLRVGVFPVRNHFYEPQFDLRQLRRRLDQERPLPGIDWNVAGQLTLLDALCFAHELSDVPFDRPAELGYYLNNGSFASGDAEFWYQLVRLKKPCRIFEIGSGNSTLMACKAILRNEREDPRYACRHVCVDPYAAPWLDQTAATVIRKKVEDLDVAFFSALERNDILFIDSSHMIRPDGDVLFEYLEVLPLLRDGVIVHVHDIFSPRNYLAHWLVDEVKLWNEQYLLEAFLTHNESWAVIGALNYLHHHHYDRLRSVAPYLTPEREPGSFYMQKRR